MKIVVTGALGHLGAKLCAHLQALGHEVTGLDLTAADAPVRVHAADRAPTADWPTVVPHNIDAVLNLFHAAQGAGVPRVVFASSNWVQGGRRFGREPLRSDTPPAPVNAYGMSKLMGERIGAHFAAAHGMTVICARIGWTQWTHDNRPGPHMGMGRWGQLMWLSDRDFLDGMTAAALAPAQGFAVVNLMSDNPGMRWSLDEGRATLGFSPQDGAPARLPVAVRLREVGAWLRLVGLPALMARLVRDSW